ncbi:ABC transporter substrate-binding protein [Bifidobacterium aquikefiri]|uniref:ABC transporter substrate-binding protein n=1 Tax=Bifidobacterium aquikefiri TaxID=1653207 RepID=UPI0039E8900A
MKLQSLLRTATVAVCASALLAGCGAGASSSSKVTLTLASNQYNTEPAYLELKKLVTQYNKEQNKVTVELQILNDYEPTMKTKMAANDLPDLFFTHGWSTTRYAEYLEPLQNRSWAKHINPLIKSRITSTSGKIYALPMEVSMGGIVFNETVLKEAGVDWQSIQTWADFTNACKKIKAAGKTPIAIGGLKDNWTVGNFFDFALPSFLVTNTASNYRKQLLNGSFDWNNVNPFYKMFMEYYDAGFFNSSIREGTNQDIIDGLSHDQAAFAFTQTSIWTQIQEINNKAKIGLMPIPSYAKNDTPVAISGEGIAIGAWKDGTHKDDALKFLDWLSQSSNINAMCATTLNPTGIVGAGYKNQAGNFNQYYSQIAKYRTFGYFDRDYLPSGMWDTLTKVGETMITRSGDEKAVVAKLQSDYDKLIKQ